MSKPDECYRRKPAPRTREQIAEQEARYRMAMRMRTMNREQAAKLFAMVEQEPAAGRWTRIARRWTKSST